MVEEIETKTVADNTRSVGREIAAYKVSDNGRCWWIQQYLSAPPFRGVTIDDYIDTE